MKQIKSLKFEISINYDKNKEPFSGQQTIAKIRNELRAQLKLMNEDGKFGKYRGNTSNVKILLTDTKFKGDK